MVLTRTSQIAIIIHHLMKAHCFSVPSRALEIPMQFGAEINSVNADGERAIDYISEAVKETPKSADFASSHIRYLCPSYCSAELTSTITSTATRFAIRINFRINCIFTVLLTSGMFPSPSKSIIRKPMDECVSR
jgi:hypothetical protein